MSERIEKMAIELLDTGLGQDAVEKAERLMAAGQTEDLIRYLRLCRCDLMDDLHKTQRRVDRMDHLIRQTKNAYIEIQKGTRKYAVI